MLTYFMIMGFWAIGVWFCFASNPRCVPGRWFAVEVDSGTSSGWSVCPGVSGVVLLCLLFPWSVFVFGPVSGCRLQTSCGVSPTVSVVLWLVLLVCDSRRDSYSSQRAFPVLGRLGCCTRSASNVLWMGGEPGDGSTLWGLRWLPTCNVGSWTSYTTCFHVCGWCWCMLWHWLRSLRSVIRRTLSEPFFALPKIGTQ